MNQHTETSPRTDALRSDIEDTRQHIDETIGQIGERMKGRHLLDEILGLFRPDRGDGSGNALKEKISHTTSRAVHSVVDTVKANPVPTLLIGAGVAWLIYESRRDRSHRGEQGDFYERMPYDENLAVDTPLGYTPGQGQSEFSGAQFGEGEDVSGPSKFGAVKEKLGEKAAQARQSLQDTASRVGERARATTQAVRQHASDLGTRVGERSRELYSHTRDRVVTTADQHPLEVGLGLLALGVVAGLAIPTPQKINELAGPTADRLRQQARERSRELVQRGRHVVQAAAQAARDEAQSQGLTPEAMRQKAGAVAQRAKDAAGDTAREEGMAPAGAAQNEPSTPVSRPIV